MRYKLPVVTLILWLVIIQVWLSQLHVKYYSSTDWMYRINVYRHILHVTYYRSLSNAEKVVHQFTEHDITLVVHDHGSYCAWKVCCLPIMFQVPVATLNTLETPQSFHREYEIIIIPQRTVKLQCGNSIVKTISFFCGPHIVWHAELWRHYLVTPSQLSVIPAGAGSECVRKLRVRWYAPGSIQEWLNCTPWVTSLICY